jgi:lipopolysaccharide/colanic/teichoic acid biosynthesis glycosyltransferase
MSLDQADARRAFAEPPGAPPVGEGPPGGGLPRALDVAIALLALLVLGPALLVVAVLIRLESPGPVIYRQIRVGRGGSTFMLYKLRTMRAGSDPVGVGTAVDRDDPRVTRIGRLLRRLSLDEVPNLFNVIRGEMAIVGPRPTIPSQVELFSPRQHRRHAVRPGITGWAQVNGRVGIEWGPRIELDIYYVEHRSLTLDLRILGRTLWQVLSGRGLYTGG